MVALGEQRLERHRVDRVGRDELVDVHRVGVARVLDAGRGPQRPLDRAADGLLARAQLGLEAPVRGARVGQAGDPAQVLATELLQALVDLGVHARDEEAGHRVHVERLALRLAALEPAGVGLGHLGVGLDGEQQRHVDVDALVDRLLDRGDARLRPGDLDHQVGPVDAVVERPGGGDGADGVVGERRCDLQ